MGGRGSSSGVSVKGQKYGTEYKTLYETGNIKFVESVTNAARTPMETMTKGRVYVTVNGEGNLKAITFYDRNNKRMKQIDLMGRMHEVDGEFILPHTHKGYFHDEKGTRRVSSKEKKLIERVNKAWYYRNNR